MIFQHTIDSVLSGEKTQTSRIWKDDYTFSCDEYDRELPNVILSMKAFDAGKIHRLYQVGQVLSVQPARGQKGVAKIRILELAKRDVRSFTFAEIEKEGFEHAQDFIQLWAQMHDKAYYTTMPVKTFDGNSYDSVYEKWLRGFSERPTEFYQALVIRFELAQGEQS